MLEPTRPLWPLKNSQSTRPAALAITFTRRAICDSDSPNTFLLLATPAGRMASNAFMAAGVMATTAPAASTSVLERMSACALRARCTRRRCNSSGVGKGIYKSVVQSDREFLNVGVSDRQ